MKSKYSIYTLFSILAIVTVFISCKKDEDNDEEEVAPSASFNITDPVADDSYMLGDTVHINAMVTFEDHMHGFDLKIINTTNGDEVVFEMSSSDHEDTYHIHHHWVNDVIDHSDMELQLEVDLDDDGNTDHRHIHFHCMP